MPYRKTKIICTIGPATNTLDKIRQLAEAGMNIARINMSHGDQKGHLEVIQKIKSFNKTAAMPIAILLDTQGPEIRTGDLMENFTLAVGDSIEITAAGSENTENKSVITVNYRDMLKDLKAGDRVTLDNGIINLEVIEKTEFGLMCKVVDGGVIKSRRHINLPGIRVNLPSITAKDVQDIMFGVKNDVDFIALSFVRTAADVEECKRMIERYNGHAQVIAKIEDSQAVQNYKEIITASHGIMVARGDLGVEVPIEELPIIQRRIVKECARQGKRVIVATHLLESMIENPIPTRAEVTDVANAAYEEVDSVMLSGETAAGKFPIKAVETLDKILKRIETSGGIGWSRDFKSDEVKAAFAESAVELADHLKSEAVVVFTRRGLTADFVTAYHPRYATVFAFTNMSQVRRKLLLNRACYPYRIDFSSDPEKTIKTAFALLIKKKLLPAGTKIVIVSDIIAGSERVESIQVRTLGGAT
ncbi:MAG: pyruvate kinase [Spirochaetes bacterium]|nr:pyruvate kinase [Spirochaetota bacterium]